MSNDSAVNSSMMFRVRSKYRDPLDRKVADLNADLGRHGRMPLERVDLIHFLIEEGLFRVIVDEMGRLQMR